MPVGDLDPDGVLLAQAGHLGGRPGVHHGVRDQFADQHHGVVHHLGQVPPEQGVPDEAAGRGGRPVDRFEGGGCARGDHGHVSSAAGTAGGDLRRGGAGSPRPGAALHPTFRLVPRGGGEPKQAPGGDFLHDFPCSCPGHPGKPSATGPTPGASAVTLGGPRAVTTAVRSRGRRGSGGPFAGPSAAVTVRTWEGPVEFGDQGRVRYHDGRCARHAVGSALAGRRPAPGPGARGGARRAAQAARRADRDARRQLPPPADLPGRRPAGRDRRGVQRGRRAQPAPHR